MSNNDYINFLEESVSSMPRHKTPADGVLSSRGKDRVNTKLDDPEIDNIIKLVTNPDKNPKMTAENDDGESTNDKSPLNMLEDDNSNASDKDCNVKNLVDEMTLDEEENYIVNTLLDEMDSLNMDDDVSDSDFEGVDVDSYESLDDDDDMDDDELDDTDIDDILDSDI